MIKWIMYALLSLATAVPTFAADDTGMKGDMKGDMKHEMHQHPGMQMQMMHNPQLKLAMAYHKNLVTFAQALKRVAKQGETVPPDFARSAITEMRRSADQMEIHHEAAVMSMPADQKAMHDEMAKKMGAHMAEMRTQLDQLDALAKGDRIDSKEVLKHLQVIFKGCAECQKGMCGERHGKGMGCGCMEGGRGHGMQGDCMKGGMKGDCMDCMKGKGDCMKGGKMHGGGMDGWKEMMQQRHKIMEAMKAQDAELTKMVDTMNRAQGDQKQAIMADIVTRLVKQRADMDRQLEQMQEHMKRHMEGRMSHGSMHGRDCDEDSESYDNDADDTNPNAMNSDDADSDTGDANMDMKGMNMQD